MCRGSLSSCIRVHLLQVCRQTIKMNSADMRRSNSAGHEKVPEGSAKFSIQTIAKCPPNGIDCSKNYTFIQKYSNCLMIVIARFCGSKAGE